MLIRSLTAYLCISTGFKRGCVVLLANLKVFAHELPLDKSCCLCAARKPMESTPWRPCDVLNLSSLAGRRSSPAGNGEDCASPTITSGQMPIAFHFLSYFPLTRTFGNDTPQKPSSQIVSGCSIGCFSSFLTSLAYRIASYLRRLIQFFIFCYRGFTKFARVDYVKWKEENRLVNDGVNAKV